MLKAPRELIRGEIEEVFLVRLITSDSAEYTHLKSKGMGIRFHNLASIFPKTNKFALDNTSTYVFTE